MPVFPPTPSLVHLHPALTYLRLADLVCQTLAERNADCAPLAWLSGTLQVPVAELRTAVDYALHLGVCQDGPEPVLYCLPRQPLVAGFEPLARAGRVRLRLPGHGLRPALLITGQRVGPVPAPERAGIIGAGELAYTVRRLTLMALDWLPDSPDPTRYLFGLITEGWRHACGGHLLGGMGIHRVSFEPPVEFGLPGGSTNRLELITNRRRTGHELVNVYPIPARRSAR